MHVDDIRTYPVKALRGGQHPSAEIEPWGLRGDRVWMVVDDNNRGLTQRELGCMALMQAANTAAGVMITTHEGERIDVSAPDETADTEDVAVWDDIVPARVADAAANEFLSRALGRPCRLVRLADPSARKLPREFAANGDSVSFADGFPVLLASTASLEDLNARLPAPVCIDRFRANIVVRGAAAWEEDEWRVVRIGGAVFDVVKPCDRCVVTTIDPETGERPDRLEPLRTLATFRRDRRGRVMFGQNLVPRSLGQIEVGDGVEVLERGARNFDVFVPDSAK
jgi:uncharacterized protein YcbX